MIPTGNSMTKCKCYQYFMANVDVTSGFFYLSCVGSSIEGNAAIDDIFKTVHSFHWSES